MNSKLLQKFEDRNAPILTSSQQKFLSDVNSILLEKFSDRCTYDALPDDTEEVETILNQISVLEQNLHIIIDCLRGGRKTKVVFEKNYPKWKKIREDGISELRHIAVSINKDRFNCNVSRLVGYSTSFLGGAATLTSAILIPFTLGLTTPLAIGAGVVTGAGCSTAIGTSITEVVLLKSKVSRVKEIIEEDKKLYETMCDWLKHAAELQKALCDILSINVVKDIEKSVKSLVEKGIKIKNDLHRLRCIEKTLDKIIEHLPKNLKDIVPMYAVVAVIAMLVAVFLLLTNTENRFVFDCAALTIRSIFGIASLVDSSMDVIQLSRIFAGNAAIAKDLAKAVTRGAVAVLGMALDVAGIVLTAIDVHKGSLSPEAKEIEEAAKELEKEAKVLEEVYGNIN